VVVELGGELGARLAVGSALVGIRFGADDDGVANGHKDTALMTDCAGPEGIPVDLELTSSTAADRRNDLRPRNNHHPDNAASFRARSVPARPIASPALRAQAREAGIDLRLVSGSGAAGRITRDDLAGYVGNRSKGTGGSRTAQRNEIALLPARLVQDGQRALGIELRIPVARFEGHAEDAAPERLVERNRERANEQAGEQYSAEAGRDISAPCDPNRSGRQSRRRTSAAGDSSSTSDSGI